MDTTPISKSELLELIRSSSARFDTAITKLDDAKMTAPGVADGHSIKDLMAHVTMWEERLLAWIARWRETGNPQRPEPGRTWDEIDAMNDRDFAAMRGVSIADVLASSRAAHARVLAEIESLAEAALTEAHDAWDGLALAWIVRANTSGHYEEHLQQLEQIEARP